MFIGHIGVGLALKKMEPKINLSVLIFAVLFLDFLLGFFVLAGIEQIHNINNYAKDHYLTFTFPYSHSLFAAILYSLIGFILCFFFFKAEIREKILGSFAIGLAISSHWVCDLIEHLKELPLTYNNSQLFGLGLWRNLPIALSLETILIFIGLYIYLKTRTDLKRKKVIALVILLLLLTVLAIFGQLNVNTPPNINSAAITWIIQPIILSASTYFIDKKTDISKNYESHAF